MKTHFSTFDIVCSVTELQKLVGLRVANVYDIDNKTYLIKLQKTDEKCVLLMESGSRFHTSAFEWPKNIAPSSFSMKMRKHLKNKRLESLRQLGMDRIVDFQFGMGEAAYHIILELYDRGNLILTDHEMTILNVLRPHTEGEKLRFAVKEKYPFDRARERKNCPSVEEFKSVFKNSKQGESLKKILNFNLEYGPAIIEHVLIEAGFKNSSKIGHDFKVDEDINKLVSVFKIADEFIEIALKEPSKGYIVQKKEEKPTTDSTKEFIYTNVEFHPFIFAQHKNSPIREFPSFDMAVDEFFSTFEGQKIELRALHQEREALKKLDNVRKDHQQRLVALGKTQEADKQKAELITRNQTLVDNAIMAVQSAVANQVSWPDIKALVKEAQENGDPVASVIKQLKLETNHITLLLDDPWANEASSDEDDNDESDSEKLPSMTIDIDLALSAFANARRYYDQKRSAAKKQQKTIESHGKALKSAEKKTKQTLKEVQTITNINKARKVFWFEKFFWFISSENYLVIGGRDQTQNELIVKRYMRPNDIYVHAEIHGASSIVIKNPSGDPVPPKTLNEAGVAAICYSVAWEAKVVTGAWWVNGTQVSKTAPTGEYLTTGSFMIRGKKNYLPPCQLSMGFGFLFKLEDGSIERHKNERCVRTIEEEIDQNEQKDSVKSEELNDIEEVEVELDSEDDDDAKQENAENKNSESNTEEDEEEEEETNAFPDTHIKIEHISGTKINLRPEINTMIQREKTEDSDNVIYLGDDKPVLLKSSQLNRMSKSKGKKVTIEEDESKNENSNKKMDPNQKKRGQKGKLKKIKEKYKYQDEEERKLRMEILQSAGTGKDAKKSKKPRENATSKQRNVQQRKTDRMAMAQLKFIETEKVEDDDKDLDDEDKEEIATSADLEILDSLTGVPDLEDELLFAVPVIAPYNSLTNYKYKIKITPGTGKKTKATRTAVSMFLRDKTTSTREKDLLRSVKDEIMTRNLPGKVKLSAPKLQSVKK